MRYFRLYVMFVTQYLKMLMEYKADFLIGILGFLFTQGSGIAFIWLVFQKIPHLNGWDFHQVVFIYGFAQLPRGLDHLLTDNLWLLSGQIIVRGEFDRYLLRPVNPLFQVVAERFQFDALGELLVGILLVGMALPYAHISITPFKALIFVVVILAGTVIYTSVKLFFASMALWIQFSQAILFMNYQLSNFAKYPLSIYNKVVRGILTFVIPFGFTAYYPAGYFVDKVNLAHALWGTLAAAALSFAVAYMTWLKGLKSYQSVGN